MSSRPLYAPSAGVPSEDAFERPRRCCDVCTIGAVAPNSP